MEKSNDVLEVIRMGHPTLSKPTIPVTDPSSDETRRVINNLIATLEANGGGAGLATPQVNISLRILIFCVPKERAEDGVGIPLTPLINPVIEFKSEEMTYAWEACFSLPKMMGEVPRHKTIRYRYQTLTGEMLVKEASGIHARVIQHEVDHLDGILYVQRMRDMSRFGHIDEIKKYRVHQQPQRQTDTTQY